MASGRWPLDGDLVAALTALWLRSLDEREDAGEGYAGPCPHCQGPHVVVDELGRPYRPEWYSDEFAPTGRSGEAAQD